MKKVFVVALLSLLFSHAGFAQKMAPIRGDLIRAENTKDSGPYSTTPTGASDADAMWNEKSYARALELYLAAQKQTGVIKDADEVSFRIAVSLGKTEQWDAAVAAGEALIQKTIWKARVLYWLGRFYTIIPHQGYKVGDVIYRGADYPKTEKSEKPQMVYLAEEDANKTLDYFERAKLAAREEEKIRTLVGPTHGLSAQDEIDLNFDLAAWVPQREFAKFIESLEKKETLDENADPKQPYDRKWHLAKKVIYLYNQIPFLDDSNDKHKTALSLLAKGLFVRAYRQRMDQWANWYDKDKKTYVMRSYPFDKLEAITYWEQLVRDYPNDEIADRTQFLIAQTWQQRNELVKALAEYRRLIVLFPQSKWVSDAKANIQQITRREISLDTMGAQPPGKTGKMTVSTRNVKQVEFKAYSVKLEEVLIRPEVLSDPNAGFTQFEKTFGSIESARKYFGPQVAAWTLNTKDKGDYQSVNETIDVPLKELGAYVIIADAGDVRFARLMIISDLAILEKTDRDGAFAFIADAQSGKPLTGANAVLKENYYTNGGNRTDTARGQSDAQGFFDKKLTRGKDIYSSTVQAFAYVGKRYALTGGSGGGWWGYGDNRDELKVYAYTDRPVYRPAQKVYFRQILTRRIGGGDIQPAKDVKLRVRVNNPKGETIYDQTLTSSEFGTVNGEFVLPAGAPLGEYYIGAETNVTNQNIASSGGNRFRVEEYKRPEFAVTVDAPGRPVRPGETVAAKINAKYYFGSPVPGATVKYTVRRSSWWAGYTFPRPFNWLYSYWGAGDYDTGRRNIGGEGAGAIVKEGTVKTDSKGNAEVSFTATKDKVEDEGYGWWWRQYSNPLYTIEAEVTDASRRTIEGQGSVRVANQQYFAFLDAKRGYYQSGDRIQIELVTQDANAKPFAAAGKMVVYKLLPGNEEKKVYEEKISTPANGRTFWEWQNDDAGTFRIAFEATDAWNNKIIGSTEIWVGGEGLNTTRFRLQGVTIVLDKRDYQEGDTLRALLVADTPGTTVLLTQEAGGEILKRELVFIEGKSREISFTIEHKHVPNFAIGAALVKNFEVYQAQQEVFVPPVRQLMDVSVTSDKATYKPGETGTFTIKARDYAGNPARAEVSVALADASLFYIQKDYAPDIRTFYYGERRGISVSVDSSKSGVPQGHYEDDQKMEQYEGHGWQLPDDMGQLNLDPGSFGWYGYYGDYRYKSARSAGFGGEDEMLSEQAAGMRGPQGPMAPMASAAPMAMDAASNGMVDRKQAKGKSEGGALAEAQVRENFAETAFWSPAVVTENGEATVKVKFPDSLTQWHATARGLTQSAQVGAAENDVETKKNLLLRLQSPRFFVGRDQVVLSANVHNYLKTDKRVKVSLQTGDGLKLNATKIAPISTGISLTAPSQMILVKAGEEARVNWTVDAIKDGDVSVQMTAQTDEESDAVKMKFPVLVHGVQRFAQNSGVLSNGGATRAVLNITFPAARRHDASTLNVQLNPSLAATMLDALPYLADYPYGCVEQTMSRFLPSVLAAKTLTDSGIDLKTLRARAKAYEAEAKQKAIGAKVQNTAYTYPTGMPNARDLNELSSQLWYTRGRTHNPIYNPEILDQMVKEGLQRLYEMQRPDGGWGWWNGSNYSDEYMSAYVMYGLATARAAEVPVRDDVLQRGFAYLQAQMKDEDNIHLLTALAYSLSLRGTLPDDAKAIVSGRLYNQRERLTAYSKSLLAMALWNTGEKAKAGVLVRNLENTAKVDATNKTARWRNGAEYWYWWNNDVETNAIALRAFLQIDPKNKLVPMMMKWLTTQARGNHWRSTKETAEAVYALADYVRVNKELDVDYTLKVNLNGKLARSYRVTSQNALYFDNRFIASDLFLKDGANTVTIEKIGKGNVYFSAASEYFSLEEPIKASGNEIAIKRRFFKLTRNPNVKAEQGSEEVVAQPSKGKGSVAAAKSSGGRGIVAPYPRREYQPPMPEFIRTELKDGAMLKSGDLVEVELTLDAANDYEYLVFEDMKAAGLEPVELRSGYGGGDGVSSNVELRDQKVAFFVDRLPQGTRALRYRMRAEAPGRFHALPTNGYAMYAPEVRAISDEMRINVRD